MTLVGSINVTEFFLTVRGSKKKKKNEIPTVPMYYLAKLQPRERAWKNQRGKKTLLSLTLVRRCEMTYEV